MRNTTFQSHEIDPDCSDLLCLTDNSDSEDDLKNATDSSMFAIDVSEILHSKNSKLNDISEPKKSSKINISESKNTFSLLISAPLGAFIY